MRERETRLQREMRRGNTCQRSVAAEAERDEVVLRIAALRQMVLDRPLDTDARDTYGDGYTAGLQEALQVVRYGKGMLPSAETDALAVLAGEEPT